MTGQITTSPCTVWFWLGLVGFQGLLRSQARYKVDFRVSRKPTCALLQLKDKGSYLILHCISRVEMNTKGHKMHFDFKQINEAWTIRNNWLQIQISVPDSRLLRNVWQVTLPSLSGKTFPKKAFTNISAHTNSFCICFRFMLACILKQAKVDPITWRRQTFYFL